MIAAKAEYVQANLTTAIARGDIGPGIRDCVTNLLAR
jgi:hypothetical protein